MSLMPPPSFRKDIYSY